jgi:hypothetical protein
MAMPTAVTAALALSGAAAAAAVGGAQGAIDTGTIHVYVQDVEDDGVVRFVLFDSPGGFPMDLDLARCVQDVVPSYSFEALPCGEYAVVFLYSENGHFPQPGAGPGPGRPGGPGGPGSGGGGIMTGMSGDSGSMPPTFEECSVSLSVESLVLQVELRTPPEGAGRPHDAPWGGPPGM